MVPLDSPPSRPRICSLRTPDGFSGADIVPDLGATVASLRLPGPDGSPRECLFRHPWFWDPDTPETRGGLPVLFPICGRLQPDGRLDAKEQREGHGFALPIHGFAMRRPWQIVGFHAPDSLHLRLADSPPTRLLYPCAFELDLVFSIRPAEFRIELTVRNTGDQTLPYYAGFHPYFATPPAGHGKERTTVMVHPRKRWNYNKTRTALDHEIPLPAFPLSAADNEASGLLLEMDDAPETRWLFPDGFVLRQTTHAAFRYRQFYTLPGAPFFCDEPWMAPPGAFRRPGAARELPPGAAESAWIAIAAEPR